VNKNVILTAGKCVKCVDPTYWDTEIVASSVVLVAMQNGL
jgi:hypothetical protein